MRAAIATDVPWFPVEQHTTPRRLSSALSPATAFAAPRSLKAPEGCKVSSFSQSGASSDPNADRITGVSTATP